MVRVVPLAQAQQFQNAEFLARQVDGPPFHLDGVGIQVDGQKTGRDDRLGMPRRTPDHGLDAGQKLPLVERLGQVVVGACLKPGDNIVGVGPSRDHDDRHSARTANAATDLEAVDARKHDVDEYDVDGCPGEGRQGLFATGRLLHLPALVLEGEADCCADAFIVLDGQDPSSHVHHRALFVPPMLNSARKFRSLALV